MIQEKRAANTFLCRAAAPENIHITQYVVLSYLYPTAAKRRLQRIAVVTRTALAAALDAYFYSGGGHQKVRKKGEGCPKGEDCDIAIGKLISNADFNKKSSCILWWS